MADGIYGFDPEIQDVDKDREEIDRARRRHRLRRARRDPRRADQRRRHLASLLRRDRRPTFAPIPSAAPPFATLSGVGALDHACAAITTRPWACWPAAPTAPRRPGVRPVDRRRILEPRRLRPLQRRRRQPLSGPRRHRRRRSPPPRSTALLEEAFKVMTAARAQIRRPLDSRAQVSISVVDTNGAVLGLVRSPDAPIFGIDVSLQKARTAAFFSSATAARDDRGERRRRRPHVHPGGAHLLRRLRPPSPAASPSPTARSATSRGPISPTASSAARPGRSRGPIAEFNPFSTGLQSALVEADVDGACRLRPRQPGRHAGAMHPHAAPRQRHPDLPRLGADLPRRDPGRRRSASPATASTRTT